MRLTGPRAYARPAPTPTMPPGLVELMEGLAKDVLKNNPENVYEFCAVHMQKLLDIRDGPGPPKKQLSLEQKIANAQQKFKQRIRNRNLQPHTNTYKSPITEVSIETTAIQQPIEDVLNENYTSDHSVIKTAAGNASAIQYVVKSAIENTPTVQFKQKTEIENTPVIVDGEKLVIHDKVEIFHELDVITTHDTSTAETSHSRDDNNVQTKVASQGEQEFKENDIDASPQIDNTTEKVIKCVEGNGVKSNEIFNVDPITELEHVTKAHEQNGSVVEPNAENVEHADNKPPIGNNDETQFNESQCSGNQIGDNAEEKVNVLVSVNLNDAVVGLTKDELNEVTSTVANNKDTEISHVDDTNTTKTDVVEDQTVLIKQELTDIQPEETFKEIYATMIEPEESNNVVLVEQEIIKNEKNADNKFVLVGSNIEIKECVQGVVNASKEDIVDQEDKLLPQTEVPTVGQLSTKQLETEAVTVENIMVDSKDTEAPKISNTKLSETGTGINETEMIAIEMTEKAKEGSLKSNDVNGHVHKDNDPKVDTELIDSNDKLPEQERDEEFHDNTTTLNKSDSKIESEDTPGSTAVSGMDLETAAITIQKVFRTFLFSKSRASTLDDTVNENSLDENTEKKDEPEYILTSSNLNKERRTLGISRMDTVLQTVNEEKSLSLSDDSSLSSAATTIQAHVRGFLVRNRLVSNKTASCSSLVNSDGPSTLSLDDVNEPKKTILNIHIVPERGQFMSRDESLLTSIDLPLDNSPPSSVNLHPLGYDKSAERRKQLKREDAVQSISPPSNNSGKLSEEIDSAKDALNDSVNCDLKQDKSSSLNGHDKPQDADTESCDTTLTISSTAETVVDIDTYNPKEVISSPDCNADNTIQDVVTNSSSDEMDVVTPYPISDISAKVPSEENEKEEKPKLVHSGEFHDIVVQTQVKRSEPSVVREFKNVLVYFLLWDRT